MTRKNILAMLRVDHAGERAAVAIGEAQTRALAPLARAPGADGERARAAAETLAQERRHLAIMEATLSAHGARPSLLDPLWRVAGLALGGATALLGPRAAMACTRAVEEEIEAHYDAQIAELATSPDADPALRAQLEALRDDERAHGDAAGALGGDDPDLGLRALRATVRLGCRAAIAVARRV